jgi:hypothetical protein
MRKPERHDREIRTPLLRETGERTLSVPGRAARAEALRRARFEEECAKLDPAEERALAEEGLAADLTDWPEY